MMSKIEWTEKTWNFIIGCMIVSPGCKLCYAMGIAHRFDHPQYEGTTQKVNGKVVWSGRINRAPDRKFYEPLRIKRPTVYFVNSMSDFFADYPDQWRIEAIQVMAQASHHTYQILTKRPEEAEAFFARHPDLKWPDHAWLGVSVENAKFLNRLDILRRLPVEVRFLSAEPLLGPLGQFNLDRIDWVISGGESGQGARLCDPDWIREIRDQCQATKTAFFHKQWGKAANNPLGHVTGLTGRALVEFIAEVDDNGKGGALLDGRLWREFPPFGPFRDVQAP